MRHVQPFRDRDRHAYRNEKQGYREDRRKDIVHAADTSENRLQPGVLSLTPAALKTMSGSRKSVMFMQRSLNAAPLAVARFEK
jgi:hypothetical protein